MKSLFGQYAEEREGAEIIEFRQGFITYRIVEGQCVIRDFFVTREARNQGIGQQLFDDVRDIAALKGCTWLACQVVVDAKNSAESLAIILSRGFKIVRAEHGVITLGRKL